MIWLTVRKRKLLFISKLENKFNSFMFRFEFKIFFYVRIWHIDLDYKFSHLTNIL